MSTQTALLDSAELAARKHGYNGFSYADLARDVGIRKASIHHHFPKKADLALSLIERYASRFADSLSEIETKNVTGGEKLKAYHALYRDALDDGAQLCLCVVLSAGRDSLSKPVLNRLNQFHRDSITWLAGVFTEAERDGSVRHCSQPEVEARATLALMEGAQLIARAEKNIALFDQATAAFAARLLPT